MDKKSVDMFAGNEHAEKCMFALNFASCTLREESFDDSELSFLNYMDKGLKFKVIYAVDYTVDNVYVANMYKMTI